jgi:hypothetical protein
MDRHELAWAAGFFDGEGWTNAVGHQRRRTTQPMARVNQAGTQGMPAVLIRFQAALGGLGRIGGPYVMYGRKDLYRWHVSSRGDVELLHHLLLPWLGQVKLNEFAEALGRPAANSRVGAKSDEWLAWCAGVFDGEGWASMWTHRSHAGYLSAEVGVGQSANDGVPEVLRRFQRVIGVGRIYGPYKQAGATMDVYRFKASALSDVTSIMATIRPWVSSTKRSDVDLVTEILGGQPLLPRGNPAWGNRKTHCINGHAYATARIRPYRSRGKDTAPRDRHQCLVCAREQARARREEKRRSAAHDDRQSISERATSYLLK